MHLPVHHLMAILYAISRGRRPLVSPGAPPNGHSVRCFTRAAPLGFFRGTIAWPLCTLLHEGGATWPLPVHHRIHSVCMSRGRNQMYNRTTDCRAPNESPCHSVRYFTRAAPLGLTRCTIAWPCCALCHEGGGAWHLPVRMTSGQDGMM